MDFPAPGGPMGMKSVRILKVERASAPHDSKRFRVWKSVSFLEKNIGDVV